MIRRIRNIKGERQDPKTKDVQVPSATMAGSTTLLAQQLGVKKKGDDEAMKCREVLSAQSSGQQSQSGISTSPPQCDFVDRSLAEGWSGSDGEGYVERGCRAAHRIRDAKKAMKSQSWDPNATAAEMAAAIELEMLTRAPRLKPLDVPPASPDTERDVLSAPQFATDELGGMMDEIIYDRCSLFGSFALPASAWEAPDSQHQFDLDGSAKADSDLDNTNGRNSP